MLMPSIYGENLFSDFFDDFPFFDNRDMKKAEKKLYGKHAGRIMSTDVKEMDDGYELLMDLPGFKKEEVQISLENGYLTIQASKGLDKSEEDTDKNCYIRRERYSGMCSRCFYVGDAVTEDDIKAEFRHGILKMTIPKKDKAKIESKKYIAIEG